MNDFYSQLERQLVEAGRRRAMRGRVALVMAGRGRPLVALAAVLLALIAAAGFMPLMRSGSSSDQGDSAAPPVRPAPSPPPAAITPPAAAVDGALQGIRVAVFNATPTPGLARYVADALARRGATIDSINGEADQDRVRSVVDHRPGAAAPARRVAKVLGVRTIRARPGTDRALASTDAAVVVRLGTDRRPR